MIVGLVAEQVLHQIEKGSSKRTVRAPVVPRLRARDPRAWPLPLAWLKETTPSRLGGT